MGADTQPPSVLRGGREYADDPAALDAAQATYQEMRIYAGLGAIARRWYRTNRRPARVLDLCAATGGATAAIAQVVPVGSATLVDIDRRSLTRARWRLRRLSHVTMRVEDACMYSSGLYDLILMNSAYHHIENDRKLEFLANARRHLNNGGRVLMGEHVLPPYSGGIEAFRASVTGYYECLMRDLLRRGTPMAAVSVIRRSGEYCWLGSYEYKTSYSVLRGYLDDACLLPLHCDRVWAYPQSNTAGSIVLELAAQSSMTDGRAFSRTTDQQQMRQHH